MEADGGPLGIAISGANVHDSHLLATTLQAIVVERPEPTEQAPQHLCLDKGYDTPAAEQAALQAGYTPHIRRIGEEKQDAEGKSTYPARRWVVERTLAWLSRWRGILVRWEKRPANYLSVLKLACGLIWYRRWYKITRQAF